MPTQKNTADPQMDLIWNNLTVKTTKDTVLDKCCGKIHHSQISILIGGIGTGKSTLFNILAGRLNKNFKIEGEVCVEGILAKGSSISLIDETFYFHHRQTVWETIYLAVKFFNIKESHTNIEKRVRDIISLLDINKISDEFLLNLSQGQRKLVNIGVILAEDPAIILLDDPFESLDKWHISKILNIFRKLTERNKTIFLSINVPESDILKKCDKIFILTDHNIIFEGSFNDYNKFFTNTDRKADDYVIDLINIDYSSKISETRDIQNIRETRHKWFSDSQADSSYSNSYSKEKDFYSKDNDKNRRKKISLLIKRHLQIFLRSRDTYTMVIIQKAIFLFVSCIVYPFIGYYEADIQTRIGLLGFLILNSIDRSMSIVLGSFFQSKLITKREITEGMYNSVEAYIAEYIFDFSLIYISTVIYIIPVYWIAQINNSLYRFILFLISHLCLVNFTVAYSIFIGIITSSPRSAHMFGSIGLLCFSAFSGIFVNVDTIPHFSRWVTWLSPMYYALEFNLQISMSNLIFVSDTGSGIILGSAVLESIGMSRIGKFLSLTIFIMYVLLFIALGLILMKRVFRPRMINEKVNFINYCFLN